MRAAVSEAARLTLGLAFLGGAAACAMRWLDMRIGPGELVALLTIDASCAAMLAILLPLARARLALVAAGLVGAAGVFAFFGTTLLLWTSAGAAPSREALLVLLVVAPLVAATISAGGAMYLARGVRRARTRRVASG